MKEKKDKFRKVNFINDLEEKCEEIYDEKE
jgi:hypothetical protein